MSKITDVTWWKAALTRAIRTAAVVAVPYVPVSLGVSDYLILLSALGMGFILSLLTSLAGISEVDGDEVPWWYAALSRVVKTVSQALITAFGSAALFTDVDWSIIPALVVTSAVGSLLLAVIHRLPESPMPEISQTAVIEVMTPEAANTGVTNIYVHDTKGAIEAAEEVLHRDLHGK